MPAFTPSAAASGALQPDLQAVFWDMDGTLVDTEPYWIEAESELVASFGGAWIDRLIDAVTARVRQSIPWRPGARELIAELLEARIPTVLVTMSETKLATEV